MASKDKLEDLNLSQDEIKRLGEALKDEKFRKLFVEYAQEISDPENKRKYEEEIAQLENERGMDVSFIHPEPGYVMKTSVDGDTKIFINICKNEKIGKPTATRKEGPDGRSGVQWSIPHSFAPPRDDLDKRGEKCRVFDVVFHPDTYRMAETNERFRKLVNDTALDGIESQYGMNVDRKNIKTPKIKYKGLPQATVIRSKISEAKPKQSSDDMMNNFPYPYGKSSDELANQKADEIKKKEEARRKEEKSKKKQQEQDADAPTVPKYTITHRSEVDLQEYRDAPDSKTSTRPKELVVAVDLPLLNSAASVGLDIFEKRLVLESVKPAAYKLDLKLPFPVDDSCGSAKFDKAKHRLTVTLPVIPAAVPNMPSYIEDSDKTEYNNDSGRMSQTLPLETNGLDNMEHQPLIQVLSSSTSSERGSQTTELPNDNSAPTMKEDNKGIWAEEEKFRPNRKIMYNFADFVYRQDNETVSFVLDVKRVELDSVTRLFPSTDSLQVTFTSLGSGCFPMHYSFYLGFPSGCEIAPDHCSIDVSEQNVVILILKSRESRGLWQKFWAGVDENHLEEKLFPTEANLELELCQLEREALANEKMVQSQNQNENEAPEIRVTEMSDKALKINLNLAKKGSNDPCEREEEDYDDLATPEIQVICERQARLHSILKQRTRSQSESSDDVQSNGSYSRENSVSSGSHMSESPISESDETEASQEGRLRKSVSFNEHVDHATFKPGATVCSMKTSLKSKRRRNRKREDKKRRRHNSTGSECSSGDEHSHPHDDDFHIAGSKAAVKEKDPTSDTKLETSDTKNKTEQPSKPKSKVIESSAKGQEDEEVASIDEAYRTSKSDEANAEISVESAPDSIIDHFAASEEAKNDDDLTDNPKVDSDDDDITGTLQHKLESPPRTNSEKSNAEKLSNGCDKIGSEAQNPDPNSSGASDKPPVTGGGCDSESALSWKESPHSTAEHKTECAFSFSNSVMFDLDVD